MFNNRNTWYKKWRLLFVMTIVVSLGVIALMQGNTIQYVVGEASIQEILVDKSQEMFAKRIAELENEVLDELSLNCEVRGVEEPDAAIVFDSNNEASIGRYQWQIKSVQYYYKELYQKDITRKEAILIALDEEKSRELTRAVLFGIEGGDQNWKICSKKLNLPEKVKIINKI